MNWKDPEPEYVLRGIRRRFFLIVILAVLTLLISIHSITTPYKDEAGAAVSFCIFAGIACIILCTKTLKRFTVYQYLTTPRPPAPEPPPRPPAPQTPQEPDEGTPIGTAI